MEDANQPVVEEPAPPPEKHPGGRPLRFETVAQLDDEIRAYFGMQEAHIAVRKKRMTGEDGKPFWVDEEYMTERRPVTMSGLARALGVDRVTLKNYAERDEYFNSIAQAKRRCEEYAEMQLFEGNSNGAKFNLTNNYADWSDKQAIDHTTAGQPIKALVEFLGDEPDEPTDSQG